MSILHSLAAWLSGTNTETKAGPAGPATGTTPDAFDLAAHNAVAFGEYGLGGAGSVTNRSITALLRTYRTHPWARTALRATALKVASTPLHAYAVQEAPSSRSAPEWIRARWGLDARAALLSRAQKAGLAREVTKHPFVSLLHRPNPWMDGWLMRYVLTVYYMHIGSAPIAVNRNEHGMPVELWPVPPHWVSQTPTPDGRIKEWVVQLHGRSWNLPREDVLWMRDPSLEDPYTGFWGTGATLVDELFGDEQAAKRVGSFFANGSLPDAIISLPGQGKPELARAQAIMEARHRGVFNAFRTFWTGASDVKVQRLDTSFKDQELTALRKFYRDTTRQVLGPTPPEVIGITENSNRANIIGADLHHAKSAVLPMLDAHLHQWVLPLAAMFDDERLTAQFDSPVPTDKEFTLKAMESFPKDYTKNERRALQGYEPVTGGDAFEPETPGAPPAAPTKTGDPAWVGGELPTALLALARATERFEGLASRSQNVRGKAPDFTPCRHPADEWPCEQLPVTCVQCHAALGCHFEPQPLFCRLCEGARPRGEERKMRPARAKAFDLDNILEALRPERLSVPLGQLFEKKVRSWAAQVLGALGAGARFDLLNPLITEHVSELSGERISLINTTTRDAIRETLTVGVQAGEGAADLARRVRDVFEECDKTRSVLIARTEVVRSSNWATWQSHMISGVVDKRRWVATPDGRTRDTHRKLNGQEREVNQAFEVDGKKAMFPGGFGIASMDCNERCTTTAVISDTFEEDEGKTWKVYGTELRDESGTVLWYGFGGAVVRVTDPSAALDYERLWKAYDDALAAWETEAVTQLRLSFAQQLGDILAAMTR